MECPSLQQTKTLDANRYATKKTIAQGMLDVALLTANASQLKYVLTVGPDKHPFYDLMLSLIIISIILQVSQKSSRFRFEKGRELDRWSLQVIVATLSLTLNLLRDCRLERAEFRMSALVINYFSLGCVSLISVLNIIISAFDPTELYSS